ncbi:non-specific protein-tyrosine kinase [Nitritalea halalkaliphila LW7]|uniref:Non-specific protein-tyrosine kinase n=1 Tax=Nitritalea halalkaliphila LW7 TaxID=1189621 RepID=I5C5Y9_9BACT|nr:hypothetical protein [Nitritalea halalkaliphila]EIM77241.1 non-specific protein-tyrosine kinase [Nitritalea halalkaliphila LW7]
MVKSSYCENLDVLLLGPILPNPAELILQDYMGEVLKEIKMAYYMVVLDSTLVWLVSETRDFFQYADASIYVFPVAWSKKAG